MQVLTLPIIEAKFIETNGKTVISCQGDKKIITVWVEGDKSSSKALLANIVINEVGDTFLANRDSNQKDAAGQPIYLKGATVTRQKESTEFKSFAGDNTAAQAVQAVNAFGIKNFNLVVQQN